MLTCQIKSSHVFIFWKKTSAIEFEVPEKRATVEQELQHAAVDGNVSGEKRRGEL